MSVGHLKYKAVSVAGHITESGDIMNINEVFELMIKENASDAMIRAGSVLKLRVSKGLKSMPDIIFSENDIKAINSSILTKMELDILEKKRGYDLAINYSDSWRFRLGIVYQQGSVIIVARRINLASLEFDKLNLPKTVLERLCGERRGLILLVGMTGSGKSTTIATMIEYINQHYGRHIVSVEEPVEYIFKDKMSLINQREIGRDVLSYDDAIKQLATISPDVLYIGDIRDADICTAVLKAAEKGMLVLSTLHSLNTQMAVETLVNMFPLEKQERVFSRLAMLLKGVIAQRLIPRADMDGMIPAYEVMTLSPTIASAIEEKRISDIPKILSESGHIYGMNTYNQCLLSLIKAKKITVDSAIDNSDNKKDMEVMLNYEPSITR